MSSKDPMDPWTIHLVLVRACRLTRMATEKIFNDETCRYCEPSPDTRKQMLVMLYRASANLKRVIEQLEKTP